MDRLLIEPLRIFEGTNLDKHGVVTRCTCALYPPLFYDRPQSWACAVRFWFSPDAMHFGYGKDSEHAIERGLEEIYGFVDLTRVQLVAEDGFDFETYTALGYTLPWEDDPDNHPGLASFGYDYVPKVYPTPDQPPLREWHGWQTDESGAKEPVTGAFYPPESDDEGHWGCVVRCPAIFASNKRIPGVDAEQAIELAEWFLIDLWNHHGFEPKLELTYAARFR